MEKSTAESLINKAERLGQSTDWKSTGTQIKALQNEWKKVNPLPKDDTDRLWQRFRQSTQIFFDRQTAHFDSMQTLRNKLSS